MPHRADNPALPAHFRVRSHPMRLPRRTCATYPRASKAPKSCGSPPRPACSLFEIDNDNELTGPQED